MIIFLRRTLTIGKTNLGLNNALSTFLYAGVWGHEINTSTVCRNVRPLSAKLQKFIYISTHTHTSPFAMTCCLIRKKAEKMSWSNANSIHMDNISHRNLSTLRIHARWRIERGQKYLWNQLTQKNSPGDLIKVISHSLVWLLFDFL